MALSFSSKRGRRVERVRFDQPLVGRLGTMPVAVTDVSLLGARLEHATQTISGSEAQLTFTWEGETVVVDIKITRSKLERSTPGAGGLSVFHSGVQFVRAHGTSAETLQNLVAAHILRALDAQKANARGVATEAGTGMPSTTIAGSRTQVLDSLGLSRQTVRQPMRSSGFCCFRLEGPEWRRIKTMNSDQPPDGFTVSLDEDQEHIAMLCETYRKANPDGRGLIRLFAQLSITEGGAARGLYEP